MNTFIEPLILYAVLFFRFFTGPVAPPETPWEFSATAEAARMVLYTGPSLALVWYLMLKVKSLREWGVGRPGIRDAIPALVGLLAISAIGLGMAAAAAAAAGHFGALPGVPRILPPAGIVPWAILVASVFAGAYLEESFFRFYMLSKRTETGYGPSGLGPHRAVLVSTVMFAFCHVHLGVWGFANAAISGTVLAYLFLRTRSLHGVSIAHAIYNVLVFALGPA